VDNGDLAIWFDNFQAKLHKTLLEQSAKFLDDDDESAVNQALKKAFRVQCDFYDPEADEYLQCKYLFKNLFLLRDSEARQANVGVEKLIST